MLLAGDPCGHLSPLHSLQSSSAPYFTTLAACVPFLLDRELQEGRGSARSSMAPARVKGGSWGILNRAWQNGWRWVEGHTPILTETYRQN